MSEVRTQGQSIIVDPPGEENANVFAIHADQQLAGWVCGKVRKWEDHRDMGYARKWKEYWRLWRGLWHSDDKNRKSERSKLIAPALAQAIEASAAEVETILLDKSNWIDVVDDAGDEKREDVNVSRKSLLDDMELTTTKDVTREAVLNAAIFGTGIIKLNVVVGEEIKLERKGGKLVQSPQEKVYVTPESIRPDEFIPDPAGKTINEMMGCAVKLTKPLHYVLEKVESGEYRREALALIAPSAKMKSGNEVDHGVDVAATLRVAEAEPVEIIEYQGKVPAGLLDMIVNGASTDLPVDAILQAEDPGETQLIEAIVTIANDSIILRAMANPFVMRDRGFIASPWERVPGRFWGRGVGEKGWNPQKALDSELRARQDSLGFISSPMLGVDAGRMPKGFRMGVSPGKIWPTNGPPRDIIQPIEMGNLQPGTFNQTQEMERMVQMGTGAFDTAQALKSGQTQSGANSVGSNSAMMSAFVKRAKRSAATLEQNLIIPMVRKMLWRYMQYNPERYPVDFNFKVNAAMGIMAREVETMQLTQLLGMMPQDVAPQVALAVTKGIVELSSVTNKNEINRVVDEALKPPSEEEQQMAAELKRMEFVAQKAQAQQFLLENQKTLAETRKILNEALVAARKADTEDRKQDGEEARILLQLEELEEARKANQLDERRLDLEERRVEIDERESRQGGSSE